MKIIKNNGWIILFFILSLSADGALYAASGFNPYNYNSTDTDQKTTTEQDADTSASSETTPAITAPTITVSPNDQLADTPTQIATYNKNFSSTIQNVEALLTDVRSRVKSYAENIRNCTTGTYYYPIVVIDYIYYITSTINKADNGSCSIDSSYSMQELGTTNIKCNINSGDLSRFADAYPDIAVITAQNVAHKDSRDSILETACKSKISGGMLQQFNQ